jgi:hypothetical protein
MDVLVPYLEQEVGNNMPHYPPKPVSRLEIRQFEQRRRSLPTITFTDALLMRLMHIVLSSCVSFDCFNN